MRLAFGTLATAALLFVSAAVGVLGSWALATGAVALLIGATVAAVAMEDRDLHAEERRIEAL